MIFYEIVGMGTHKITWGDKVIWFVDMAIMMRA